MGDRVGKSFADLLALMQQMISGMMDSPQDPKQQSYANELSNALNTLRNLNDRQEKLRAELSSVSELLKAEDKKSRILVAKSISYLESEHGKTSPILQKYGITKRQIASNKPSAKKVTKTPVEA